MSKTATITGQFRGIREWLTNPGFNPVEFNGIRFRDSTPQVTPQVMALLTLIESEPSKEKQQRRFSTIAAGTSISRRHGEIVQEQDAPATFKPIEFERFGNQAGLTNLESLNSVLVRQGLPTSERLLKLNEIAINKMRTLLADSNLKRLKS